MAETPKEKWEKLDEAQKRAERALQEKKDRSFRERYDSPRSPLLKPTAPTKKGR
jgi:hypothetical protein